MDWIMFRTATSFISRMMSFLYGTLTPVVTILLFIVTCFDFMYLLQPTISNLMDKTFDGKRFGGFHLMSHDAIRAKEESYRTMQPGIWLYLGIRIRTYVYVVFIFYFVLGGGPRLLQAILNYVSLVLEQI